MIWPIIPDMTNSGKNAQIDVKAADITGIAMRCAPLIAASSAERPSRLRVSACSPTTMASSTIMPITIIRPNKLIMLML